MAASSNPFKTGFDHNPSPAEPKVDLVDVINDEEVKQEVQSIIASKKDMHDTFCDLPIPVQEELIYNMYHESVLAGIQFKGELVDHVQSQHIERLELEIEAAADIAAAGY